MIKEFKEFIARGNVMELAVAVVLGAAFNEIVNSLVANIITPLIGMALGGLSFIENLKVTVGSAELTYGVFLQAIIDFLITAFALFLIVKAVNRFQRKNEKKEEVKKQVEPSQEVVLLTQIRDAVSRNNPPTPVRTEPAPRA